jgi:hypothetical protein
MGQKRYGLQKISGRYSNSYKKRKIFAMVVYKNKLYYVSKTGYIIGKAGVHSGYGYPVITGLNTDNSGVYFKKLKKLYLFKNFIAFHPFGA